LTFISSNYVEALECHSHSSNDKSNAVTDVVAVAVAVASVVAIPVKIIVTVVPIAVHVNFSNRWQPITASYSD